MGRVYIILLVVFPLGLCAQDDLKRAFKKGVDTSSYIPKGLSVGDKAPKIDAYTFSEKTFNSETVLTTSYLVLIFYRGQWCPVCNRYLSNLSDSINFIKEKNAKVVVVGPEPATEAKEVVEKTNKEFILIPDTSLKISKDYDVLFDVTKKYQSKIKTFLRTDIAENNDQDKAQLPVPATYIIDKSGNIIWRHFDYNYSKRASVKSIVDHIK